MEMHPRPMVPRMLLFGVLFFVTGQHAFAWGDDDDDRRETPCERTAETMFKACLFDAGDNLQTTIANCRNISDGDARRECREEARATRVEEVEFCGEVEEAREDVCELLDEYRYDPDPLTGFSLTGVPITFVLPDSVNSIPPNPYFSLVPGTTQVLRAGDPEEGFPETIVVHVTDEFRTIFPDPDDEDLPDEERLSVDCRVVVDIVLEDDDGELVGVEVTDDWYTQSMETGDVYYCGELSRNFEDGVLRDLDGSFESGREFAKAGLLISANPDAPPFAHRQEFALGEAEDTIRYVGTAEAPGDDEGGENPNGEGGPFNCAAAGGCVKTEEFIPTEPSAGEFKYFLAGTGFVLGVALEDGEPTGERDELVCIGDSLAVLEDASCGIADPGALLAELCRLSPDAFCIEE